MSNVPDPADKPTLTVEELADFMHLGRSAAYGWVNSPDFPVQVLRHGNRIMIPTAALLEVLGQGKVEVILPPDPPELTPKAARLLLRIILEAASRDDG